MKWTLNSFKKKINKYNLIIYCINRSAGIVVSASNRCSKDPVYDSHCVDGIFWLTVSGNNRYDFLFVDLSNHNHI